MQKPFAIICGLSLVLSTNAFAQDAPVTECDRYAASDQDPQRKSVGVPFAEIDPALAIPACESALRQYPNSVRLAYQLARAYYKANNFDAALAQLRKPTDQGYAVAQTTLGVMYENGHGVPQDYAQAVAWYRKAADQGNAHAQNNLARMYENGWGVPQDYAQAIAGYRKAADQGNAVAQYNLGLMYEKGRGVPQDYTQAAVWYRKAADQGLELAQKHLDELNAKRRSRP